MKSKEKSGKYPMMNFQDLAVPHKALPQGKYSQKILKRRTDLNEPAPTKKFALMVPAGHIRMPTSIALDEMRKIFGVFLRLTDIAVRS